MIRAFAGALSYQEQSNLMKDLLIVDYWNRQINDRLPVTYNHMLQGGYIQMPSARMGCEGEFGFGYAYVPPYRNWNLRMQVIDRLEITGNYRVFHGVEDPVLSPLGFGDFSDKGANFKLSLFSPEDSEYQLPGIAFGCEDFMGTKSFHARYVVLTQVLLKQNLEVSLGYGTHRIKGLFGGICWMPFRQCDWPVCGLSLVAEYDATPYRKESIELHPRGRVKNSPVNIGIKYRLWNQFDFSASYIRGAEFAFSASTYYNFGTTKGFIPKVDDPLPYTSPVNNEPLGIRRPEDALTKDLAFAFRDQGYELMEIRMGYKKCKGKILYLKVMNETFRLERDVRERLDHILAYLIPNNIAEVVVVMESEGFPVQEYRYNMELVRAYRDCQICAYELRLLTPLCEVNFRDQCESSLLYRWKRNWFNFELLPKTHTLFGTSRGKFKYSLGLHAAFNGFLSGDVYYSILLGYNFFTDFDKLRTHDILNPSQIINVRSDVMRYYKQKGITVDEAYLQKNWNMGKGWFSRAALGLFEEEYGGVTTEFLYYPVKSLWAIGVEGALLGKRTVKGVGFTNKVVQFHGITPTHRKFIGSQYFLNLYYDWRNAQLDFKIAAGQFLAKDFGARFEMSRYFTSGFRVTVWYTWTNGNDRINGQTYHDKGVYFSLPFDIFYTHSERSRWGYGMSAWLRDVGVQAYTGQHLYEMIRDQRQNH